METQDCHFFRVEEQEYERFAFTVAGREYRLRSRIDVEAFIDHILAVSPVVYVDITGLSHHVWAPLISEIVLRVARFPNAGIQLAAVYVEPVHYTKSKVPRPGDIFALSDKLHGIRPLPGLVRLRRHESDKAMIVALLGFEGWRFDAVLAKLEPDAGTVVPVIGVPGFRAEYPFYTLEGNIIPLERDGNWTRRKFATANDPFEVYHILEMLQTRHPETLLRVALVGTKPHALGAVIFHAVHPGMSELIYDNPVRSAGRTDSDRTLLEYDVSSFLGMMNDPSFAA
ncbi:MAG TPA: hypothetical protein VFJ16_16990 [Longimicrobium sp.]|nr:hypothetical protein [Longimicrobium sp.]